MKWLDKFFKEKVVPEITRLEEFTSRQAPNISEPVYAITRATRDKLNRWKFSILGSQITIEDKHTGRNYLFDKGYLDEGGNWRHFSYLRNYDRIDQGYPKYIFKSGNKYYLDYITQGMKGYQLRFLGYENVFSKDEKSYLQNSFQKLMDRKIEQAKRVHDRYVYRAEIRDKDIEKKSIRAGLEIRAKMLEEYK